MDTVFDAFTQGTQLGGLRTKNDVRVLLCYILKSLDAPFSKSGLNEVLQSTALANFFEVNDALSALTDGGLVTCSQQENDVYYTLTARGREIADRLETDLPLQVRRRAVASAVELLSRERARFGTETEIKRLSKGYHVLLTVKDGETVMMQTLLYAADSLQANAIADAFSKEPGKLYAGIINALEL